MPEEERGVEIQAHTKFLILHGLGNQSIFVSESLRGGHLEILLFVFGEGLTVLWNLVHSTDDRVVLP